MEINKKTERSLELRSEKVRSIVGQIPPRLVRYGNTIIAIVLLLLVGVAYLLPYKQVYSGVASLGPKNMQGTDSIEIHLLLRFEHNRPIDVTKQQIVLYTDQKNITGRVLRLSPQRDTLERQEALCRFASQDISSNEGKTLDFSLIYSTGNLLQQILGDM